MDFILSIAAFVSFCWLEYVSYLVYRLKEIEYHA